MSALLTTISPAWMFAATVIGLLIVLAATALERVVQLRRGTPSRWVWALAMVATMGISARLLVPDPVQPPAPVAVAEVLPSPDFVALPSLPVADVPAVAVRPSVGERLVTTMREASASAARLGSAVRVARLPEPVERGALALWVLLTVLFGAVLLTSAWRLRRERQQWPRERVMEHEVRVSEGFGPAIVGIRAPEIVIPRWVLALAASAQRTIVVHEDEHRRVGDQRLLLGALTVLALMPWNVGLWLMWRRLARAIEFDCDERVVQRGVPSGEYAQVLLSAWQRSHDDGRWMPTPAFAERATGLGRRVEHLLRPAPRRRVMKAIGGVMLAVLCVGATAVVPGPARVEAAVTQDRALHLDLVVIDGVARPEINLLKDRSALLKQGGDEIVVVQPEIAPGPALAKYGSAANSGASAYWSRRYIERGGAILDARAIPTRPTANNMAQQRVIARYYRLFEGISLPPSAMVKAYDALLAEDNTVRQIAGASNAEQGRAMAAEVRNTALRALLVSKGEQATFAKNLSFLQSKGQAIPESEWGPPPLILIDGVKHPELKTAAAMFAAFKDRTGDDRIGMEQTLDSLNGRKLYGDAGKHGAIAIWTLGYLSKGGKTLGRASVKSEAAPAATGNDDFSLQIAARLERGLPLNKEFMLNVVTLVFAAERQRRALASGPYLAVWPQLARIQAERDSSIRALLTNDKDRATFDANAKEEALAPLASKASVVKTCSDNYFRSVKVTADERRAGMRACQSFVEQELALYKRIPGGSVFEEDRAKLIAQRHAAVIAGMKDPEHRKQVEVLVELWRRSDMDRVGTDAKVVPSTKGKAAMKEALNAMPAAREPRDTVGAGGNRVTAYGLIAQAMMRGLELPAATQQRFRDIVMESSVREWPLYASGIREVVVGPTLRPIQEARDAKLRALLTTDAQRARFTANTRVSHTPELSLEVASIACANEALDATSASARERDAVTVVCQQEFEHQRAILKRGTKELFAYFATPQFRSIDDRLRRVLTPATRAAFDREQAKRPRERLWQQDIAQGGTPLYVINGVKRTDLTSPEAFAADAKARSGDDEFGVMQKVNAENAMRLYGIQGRNGAMVVWTRGYKGAMLPPAVVEGVAERKSDATPQARDIAAQQMANLLKGANPSAAARAKISEVFVRSVQDFIDAAGPYLVTAARKNAILARRNAEVNALLTSAADRSAFASNLEAEPKLTVRSANFLARAEANGVYFGFAEAPQELKDRAVPIIEAALIEEGAAFEKDKADTATRKAITARKDAAVRALITDPVVLAIFDKRMTRIHSQSN